MKRELIIRVPIEKDMTPYDLCEFIHIGLIQKFYQVDSWPPDFKKPLLGTSWGTIQTFTLPHNKRLRLRLDK